MNLWIPNNIFQVPKKLQGRLSILFQILHLWNWEEYFSLKDGRIISDYEGFKCYTKSLRHIYMLVCVFFVFIEVCVLNALSYQQVVWVIFSESHHSTKLFILTNSHKSKSQTYLYLILLPELLLTGMWIFRHFLYLYELCIDNFFVLTKKKKMKFF